MDTPKQILEKRDQKAKPHLEQYAPVWIIDEKVFPEDSAVQFNVVFQHNIYGWVNRRYRFDAFNNVLYYKGQNRVDEDRILAVQEKEPYISRVVADVRNSYGG